MPALLWPGDDRAGEHLSDSATVRAMVQVETAWLATLVEVGIAPRGAAIDLGRTLGAIDAEALAVASEAGGNPVIPLVTLMRGRLADTHPKAAQWVHRGLTSQDVLDTALVLGLRDATDAVLAKIDIQIEALVALADRHRSDLMAGRTLTQHAVPVTFGLTAAYWLHGVLEARADLRDARNRLPIQIGSAAGTLAAPTELLRLTGGHGDAIALARNAATRLGLPWSPPWHTVRAPLTRLADALTRASDAWGHIAADVLVRARPEIAELAEPTGPGRGSSSTMPHKANPVLSVLIRRAALTAPNLAAQLHLAAATTVDERPDGAWHTEWTPLAELARHTVTAADQTAELLTGLHVDTGRMARTVQASASALLAEQHSLSRLVDEPPETDFDPNHYLGSIDALIDDMLERARTHAGGQR
ncbi:lyase family protein [Nocardia fluminea]|uniref:3-carboxy-cis,cis-muconate cycloisomerase n=1 Tax=Nocardia fluminea TaxID=134984 RepID=A0A2N3V5L4_9NOCA|nr:lyase family protein [Nocardia fluminea]PKV76923.1 3-carboxy-cis,cis-muconate cycloisomerase [Nocardia fluminea]